MSSSMVQYRVIGMDCAKDAAEIKHGAASVAGVTGAEVSTATHILTLHVSGDAATLPRVEQAVSSLGYRLQPLADVPATSAHADPQFRRALWVVVVLNTGYGIVEMMGGALSDSQALKADALDFIGDGLITFIGIVAIAWNVVWRARAALLQGLFLGALGLGVLFNTAYRILHQQQPEAGLMGAFGIVALAVNVAAAAVLVPHRHGDANVRAVWLFSRNDALGNVAVVVAAGLVAWSRSPWPDIVVATLIAGLFLHSAATIIRDAVREMRQSNAR